MHDLKSLSLFVGTGRCNANCAHCAGRPLRHTAPEHDGDDKLEHIRKVLIECYERGARNLSISCSGEPTLSPVSVTSVLQLTYWMSKNGQVYKPINLYTNGIKIGENAAFCQRYLGVWKLLGLTHFYMTVHSCDEKTNAKVYGVKKYPPLKTVIGRMKEYGFKIRANVVLNREYFDHNIFIDTATKLLELGVDSISAWPIRDSHDEIDKGRALLSSDTEKIVAWASTQKNVHIYSGMNDYTHKITLFHDGQLTNKWCNH